MFCFSSIDSVYRSSNHFDFMIARLLFIAGSFSSFLPVGAAEGVPPVQARERLAPWGTVVERASYYVKNGKEVEHGVEESFSPDGTIASRIRYAHGKEDGISEFFYDGIGTKQTEMSYVAGVEDGPFRTWTPDGKLLFEGIWKNGEMQDGWFEQGSTSSRGGYHRNGETWKIVQWKDGKEVPGSNRVAEASWRTWTPGKLPDQKMFIRWRWPLFAEQSTYPFMDRMPVYQDVPFLIKCFEKKGEGYKEASDQLQALTRMQFGNPWLQTDPERTAATAKWRAWWEDVGRHRPEWLTQRGVRDAEAWDLARRGRNLPMPEEPLVIPETYVLKVQFSYFGHYWFAFHFLCFVLVQSGSLGLASSHSAGRTLPQTRSPALGSRVSCNRLYIPFFLCGEACKQPNGEFPIWGIDIEVNAPSRTRRPS